LLKGLYSIMSMLSPDQTKTQTVTGASNFESATLLYMVKRLGITYAPERLIQMKQQVSQVFLMTPITAFLVHREVEMALTFPIINLITCF
jgi:hypothetical protein